LTPPAQVKTVTAAPGKTTVPATQQPTLADATQIPCDQAAYVRDISVPDGTILLTGTTFVKTWEIKNTGSCSWDQAYAIVFGDEGDQMNGKLSQPLISSGSVAPGAKVNISVALTAPGNAGDYKGFWKLRNSNGNVFFGVNKGIWVAIKTIKFDKSLFLNINTCNAIWRNSSNLDLAALACPGNAGDARGSVLNSEKPLFYNYEDNETAIQVEPQQINDGFIVGAFPPILIPGNARFRTVVGCGAKMDKCNARIVITGQELNGNEETLKDFTQKAADDLTIVNVDLAAAGYTGKNVVFRIYVRAAGSPVQDRILFLGPVIDLKP
jgi:hypothetical protein